MKGPESSFAFGHYLGHSKERDNGIDNRDKHTKETEEQEETRIENIYTEAYGIIEEACKKYDPEDKFFIEAYAAAYKINSLQRDRLPENTGGIDGTLKTLTLICLRELANEYAIATEVFYKNFLEGLDENIKTAVDEIFKHYNKKTRDLIFGKYSEYVDASTGALQYMKDEFNKGKTVEEHYVEIDSQYGDSDLGFEDDPEGDLAHIGVADYFNELGCNFLTKFSQERLSNKQVNESINNSNVEINLYKSFFHRLKEANKNLLYEMGLDKFDVLSGPELSQEKETIERMKKIYLNNYTDFPEEFKKKIIEGLEAKLRNENSKFYVLYHKNKPVAFNSFTPLEDGTVHFANFNVDPVYNSAKLGEAMMEASLDNEAKAATVVAEAVPGLPITETYLNKKNFQKTGEIEVAGVKLRQIRREKEQIEI